MEAPAGKEHFCWAVTHPSTGRAEAPADLAMEVVAEEEEAVATMIATLTAAAAVEAVEADAVEDPRKAAHQEAVQSRSTLRTPPRALKVARSELLAAERVGMVAPGGVAGRVAWEVRVDNMAAAANRTTAAMARRAVAVVTAVAADTVAQGPVDRPLGL